MATIGLGVQFSASASGMAKGLSQVDKLLQNLGRQASQAASLFDGFASSSGAAAAAQQQVATDIAFLGSALKTGQISAEQYAVELKNIVGAAQQQAAAFAEGARITAQQATAEENRAATLARLGELLQAGALKEEAYSRAVAEASGANAAAAAAEQQRAADQARASQIIEANLSTSARAQKQYADSVAEFGRLRQAGVLGEQDYAAAVARAGDALQKSTGEQAARQSLLREAEKLNAAVASSESRQADELRRLESVYATGTLTIQAYNAEKNRITGVTAAAAEAERQLAADTARAAQIVEANLTAEERASRDYAAAIEELNRLRQQGLLDETAYARGVERNADAFAKATIAANKYDAASEKASDGGTLKFNELSGVLSALPGPIGNVAGRLSGLASASEGLGRIFSGGLSGGLTSIGTSVAGLINPFTVGLAAVAAFGTGAVAVAQGLGNLEDRVENLGNIADKLGVSFEFIQVLEESANRSGTSIDAVSAAFGRLQKNVLGVDEESKAAQKALAEIGVEAEALQALGPEEQYRLIGERLAEIEDPARRTATATALFGKAGADLLPFFRNLGGATADIERLGGSLSALDRDRIDEFGAGLDALGVASGRLGELLLVPFVGLGEGVAQGSAEFIGGINAIVSVVGDVLEPFLSGLGAAIEVVGVVLGGIGRSIGAAFAPLGDLFQTIGGFSDAFNEAFVDVVRFLVDAQVATTEWIVSFSPVALLVDGIEALSAGFSQLAVSLAPVAELAQRIGTVVVAAFTQLATAVGEAVSTTIGYVVDAYAAFYEFVGVTGVITSFASAVTAAFNGIWEGIKNVVSQVGGFIERVVSFAEDWLGITSEVETPIVAELDISQPSLAATQFASQIGDAAAAAAEFGNAGFEAALQYQKALEDIAGLQQEGTYSAEEAKKAADNAKAEFESTINVLEQEADAQKKAADEAKKAADEKVKAAERAADAAIESDRRRADSFIQTQGLGGEDPATKAAEDLLAITRQIDEAETAIVEARASSDAAAEQAATRRLAILDQAQAAAQETMQFGFSTQDAEKAINDVRDQIDETFTFENFQIAPDAFTTAQEQLRQLEQDLRDKTIDPQTFETAADAIRSGFEDALDTSKKIADLNEKYAEQAAEIEKERLDNLNKLGPATVKANDIRTSEGATQFLQLATGQQDPAIEEYRKQLSKLDDIKREIAKIGGTVEIVGAG